MTMPDSAWQTAGGANVTAGFDLKMMKRGATLVTAASSGCGGAPGPSTALDNRGSLARCARFC